MSQTITLQTTLELHVCPDCGIEYAAPDGFFAARRNDHRSFFCPNGHSLSYRQQSDAEKAQAEAERYKRLYEREQRYSADVVSERNAAQQQLKTTKGQLTKLKKRVANGVCPVCHRTFAPLSEHMHMEHPDYTEESTT